MSIRTLAERYRVHRGEVRRGLENAVPPESKPPPPRTTVIDRVRPVPVSGAQTSVTPQGRLDSLTGLRWLAALAVFSAHFRGFLLITDPGGAGRSLVGRGLMAMAIRSGAVGVSCFFLLSGFVLAWCARPDDTARRFWQRRLSKIYPLHFLAMVAAVFFGLVTATTPGWHVVLAHLLLVQSWTASLRYCLALNAVTWSLSCEAFFYLCFPALYAVMSHLRTTALRITAIGSIVAILVLPLLAGRAFLLTGGHRRAPTGAAGPFISRFAYFFPGMRLLEFVIGMAVALLVRHGRWRGPGIAVSILGCTVLYAVDTRLHGLVTMVALMVVPLVVTTAAIALRDIRGQHSPLRSRALVWLGEVSYAFYVSHFIILVLVAHFLKPVLARHPLWWPDILGLYAGTLALCVLVAWGLHRGVENPLMRHLSPTPRDEPAQVADRVRLPARRRARGDAVARPR